MLIVLHFVIQTKLICFYLNEICVVNIQNIQSSMNSLKKLIVNDNIKKNCSNMQIILCIQSFQLIQKIAQKKKNQKSIFCYNTFILHN